ncbi:EamA family transporter [Flavobacterium sp. Sd200]|uniref:EamA family transporter n=1 Tax=Flavobacterium sp. Sd200 TaxID=2692211 RepID=UPI00137183B8|nr:DMT family transporter [Flavobacterium sp. Sd200]MXN91270.1 EamA family transporter [Flavobacterium sp. Sd200]
MNKYIAMVLLGAVSYGMLSSFAKIAYGQGYNAAQITFLQASVGAVILWVGTLLSKKQSDGAKQPFEKLLLAGIGVGASSYTYYLSVQYIPASLAIVLLMQMVWISIFAEWVLFKRRPLAIEVYVTLIILTGTVFAADLLHMGEARISVKGVVYAVLSSVMYSVYIIAASRLGNDVPMFKKSALMMTGSAMAIFLINIKTLTQSAYDLNLLGWGLFLAIFGTVIPPVMFTKGMPKIGAGLSSILLTMEMPVAIMFAHFLLNEQISALQLFGVFLILGAIVWLNIKKMKQAKKVIAQ